MTVHQLPDLHRARAFEALFAAADDEAASALLATAEGRWWFTEGAIRTASGPVTVRAIDLLLRVPEASAFAGAMLGFPCAITAVALPPTITAACATMEALAIVDTPAALEAREVIMEWLPSAPAAERERLRGWLLGFPDRLVARVPADEASP